MSLAGLDLVDKKLNTSHQCARAGKRINSIQCCIRQSITGRTTGAILPLCLALVMHLQCWIQIWTPKGKKDRDVLDGYEVNEGTVTSGIWEAERAGGVQPGEGKAQGNLSYACKWLVAGE